MGFSGCLCHWPLGRTIWAPVLGRCQRPGLFNEPNFFLGLVSGLARLFFKPYQLPPSPWLRRAWARDVSFLESGATSTWPFKAGLVRALSPVNRPMLMMTFRISRSLLLVPLVSSENIL